MNLKGILTIATFPGLYRHVAQATNGIIVESIVDGKRTLAFGSSRISALEDISIYTNDGDVKLADVYRSMFKVFGGKETSFNPKKASNDELKDAFGKALPNYDEDRVYVSDMKRAFVWYNLLLAKGLVDDKEDEPETKETENADGNAPKAETPAQDDGGIKTKKRTRKKATPKDGEEKKDE
ncbi:MAG: DUF5606 domain-containing protein [Bacteroidales bacterium]|nr:DUF5606 domain-containing protein [Bacteroidales bacterium]